MTLAETTTYLVQLHSFYAAVGALLIIACAPMFLRRRDDDLPSLVIVFTLIVSVPLAVYNVVALAAVVILPELLAYEVQAAELVKHAEELSCTAEP